MTKIQTVIEENAKWREMLGMNTIVDVNRAIDNGDATKLIQVSEALQEQRIVSIANNIAARPEVRTVLLAGPSSSGKTTTSKRLCKALIFCRI